MKQKQEQWSSFQYSEYFKLCYDVYYFFSWEHDEIAKEVII